MSELTNKEIDLLRRALGLSFYSRTTPTRNCLFLADAQHDFEHIELLIERGYMQEDSTVGPRGKRYFVKATDAGREAVLAQKWQA